MSRRKLFVVIIIPVIISISVRLGVKWLLEFDDIPQEQRLKISKLTSHLGKSLMTVRLSKAQVEQYQNNGFLIYRNAIDEHILEAMKVSAMHVMENPNGLLQLGNETKFCGFSLHNDILLDFWRQFMFKLPLSNLAADLMETSQVVYSQDIIHATSVHCGDDSVGAAHSDQNQTPFSIEKKVIRGYVTHNFVNKGINNAQHIKISNIKLHLKLYSRKITAIIWSLHGLQLMN